MTMTFDRSKLAFAGAAALIISAGACSDATSPNSLDDAIVFDMALVAADATLEDVTLWTQPFDFGPFPVAPGSVGGQGSLSGTREVTFYDVGGNVQPAYDSLTTASIHIVHDVDGEVTRDGWTITVHRERDRTVSGLEGIETHRTWNGTGSEVVSRTGVTLDGEARSYDAEGTFAYNDVVVPIPGSVPRYPVSGTITRSLSVTVTGAKGTYTKDVDVVITFDGDSTATAVVNGESREIDLTTQDGHLPFRRRG